MHEARQAILTALNFDGNLVVEATPEMPPQRLERRNRALHLIANTPEERRQAMEPDPDVPVPTDLSFSPHDVPRIAILDHEHAT